MKKVIFVCKNCFKEFSGYGKRTYCSTECLKIGFQTQLKGENNPNYRHGMPLCVECGKEISRNTKKRCLQCKGKMMTGSANPYFGKTHNADSLRKMSLKSKGNKRWLGKKHKVESKIKIGEFRKKEWQNATPEWRQERIENLKKITLEQLNLHPTVPENKIAKMLDEKGVKYQRNAYLYDKFFVDFLLDDGRIIEVFGDYWHGNEDVFPTLNNNQIKQKKKDKSKLAYLKACGREVIVVWERDVDTFSF